MSKGLTRRLEKREAHLPSRFIYRLATFLIGTWQKITLHPHYFYHFDKKEMKGRQVILLADHASWSVFFYVAVGYPFVDFNVVVGYHQAFRKFLFGLMMSIGCIFKRHFETDLGAVRQMLKIVRMGGSLMLFPEGTFSFSGTMQPINPSTVDMLQKLELPVVLCRSYGAYCARPVYKKRAAKKSYQEFHYEILFTPEELRGKTKDELSAKLAERMFYNDFEWNREAQHVYRDKAPLLEGADKILYRCPRCGAEFAIHSDGGELVCEACGNRVTTDEYYRLRPADSGSVCPYRDISEWYIAQRRQVREEVRAEDFSLSYDCTMMDYHRDRVRLRPFYPCGEGRVTIDRSGVRYVGTRHGETVDCLFEIRNLPGYRCEFKLGNVFYHHGDFYSLVPKQDIRKAVKYMMVVEELHGIVSPVWDKARCEAYGYPSPEAAQTL